MFEKRAETKIGNEIFVLNNPRFKDGITVDQHLVINQTELRSIIQKTASHKEAVHSKDGVPDDSLTFDLEAEISAHPDSLFVKCFAIKADEMNDNGDYFPKHELRKATGTFVGVPIFTNHQNTDINQARGKVVHSWWEENRNGIMIIARVDSAAYPQLARGIKENYVAGTSMGCQVKYSICSVCHNLAENPTQYCGCIKERKTRKVAVKNQKCKYHEYGADEECPICGSTKTAAKKVDYDGPVFEYNYGIKFIENSFVVNPACHDCGVTEVIDPAKFLAKVADLQKTLPFLLKAAAATPTLCDDKSCVTAISNDQANIILESLAALAKGAEQFQKVAGQEQLNDLNQALNLLTSVSQDMLKQKDQLDLEFLSDLINVLADLQTVTDELTEQGYGRLPSPGQEGSMQAPQPGAPQQAQPPQQTGQPKATGGASKVHSGPAGDAGTVTSPMANKKIQLEKLSQNLIGKTSKQINILPKLDGKEQSNKSFKFSMKLKPQNFKSKLKDLE